ncbi:MAG: LysE/ArgO family amino acid transporter [Gammaproteobacteria bacterium]|nr:LysE/ArgO family amino acid transporter [Gammaproteobacteria bacterium]MDA7970095.1 LysE/ArgO family amino acid transporter [Gammaproteobacteria bacterium]MDA7995837.1 LysE/ArgO family amino acid transporter [Gammaproteobacteria bacterium]MDA8024416.1 LysE/ArgO family amino acid transporter [Gammaproteobacteria bacterium]
MTAFTAGLSLSFSLIIAIGAQNAFVLRQGLRRRHVAAVCLLCSGSDAALIAAGVYGFDQLSARAAWLDAAARLGGAAFLFAYGARSFWAAWRAPRALHAAQLDIGDSLAATVGICLALTWLNPHVYLDTLVLLGSVSTQYAGAKAQFAGGAMLASFLFFFMLGYGARLLLPFFSKPASWRVLDAVIGAVMWTIAAALLL